MTATVPPQFRYLQRAEQLIRNLSAGTEFTNADIYARMKAAGWPDMTEPRKFGPMLQRLQRARVVEKVGWSATVARSHGGVASVWRRINNIEEKADE
jgi:alkylation response protein AidB-like acyl-CoA dehydrogenase